MDAQVMTSFAGTPAFNQLCQQPIEKLVQHILVQRDMIRTLRDQQTDTRELADLRDQLSCSNCRILELKEMLGNTRAQLRQIVDDGSAEWEWDE